MPRGARATLMALLVWAVSADTSGAWMRELFGSRASADTLAAAAATPDGDLVTVGCPSGIMLLDGASGHPRWQRDALMSSAVCRPTPGSASLVVTADGTILTAGGAGVTARDGRTGDVVWAHEVEGWSSDDPAFLAMVAVAPGSDVVATGQLDQGGDESRLDWNFLVERLDRTDGHVVWRALLDGSPRILPDDCGECYDPGYPADRAAAVTVRDGLVIAAGIIERGDPRFAVIAFDEATGAEAWRWESPVIGEAFAVAPDGAGVVAAGRIGGEPAVVAFDPHGTIRWQASVAGGDADAWHVLSIGGAGDIVASGRVGNRAAIAGYTTAGSLVWRHDEPDAGDATALARNASGLVALIALDPLIEHSLGRWRVRALDPASGTTAWVIDPTPGRPAAVASAAERLFVAGTSEAPATFRDATAIALAPDSGRERWRRDVGTPPDTRGGAEAVAASTGGNVVATGYVSNADTGYDFMVTALAPRTGRVRWQRELDATTEYPTYDYGHAVRIDARGDVVVAGSIGQPFTVVKLDGATGADRWKATSDPIYEDGSAFALAIDARNDVIAGGHVDDTFEIRKLGGDTGAMHWRRAIGDPFSDGVAFDVATVAGNPGNPTDDVIAVGFTPDAFYRPRATIVRLAGASGEVMWDQGVGEGRLASLAVHGDAVAVGGHVATGIDRRSGIVASLDAATGAERWRSIVGSGSPWVGISTVRADARGDVFACGAIANAATATVSKHDRATGQTRWEQLVPARWSGFPGVTCELDPNGNIVVATPIEPTDGQTQLRIALLDGTNGATRWERRLRDPVNPRQLAIDAVGNMFLAIEQIYPDGFAVIGLGPGRAARPRRTKTHRDPHPKGTHAR